MRNKAARTYSDLRADDMRARRRARRRGAHARNRMSPPLWCVSRGAHAGVGGARAGRPG